MLYSETDFEREFDNRKVRENKSHKWRSDFRRDYARLLHSPSFRRLMGKTQVFPNHESDFFRNRLTHSLEVAQVAKSIACKLNAEEPFFEKFGKIDLDLIEFAGLAHDLGHPPFGHNGEHALDECMKKVGGFEGNAQTLRIVSKIEKKAKGEGKSVNRVGIGYRKKDVRHGLNLSYRALASILKYDNEIPYRRSQNESLRKGYYDSEAELVETIKAKVTGDPNFATHFPDLSFKTLECYIMDVADDIAYSTFDLEDTFKAGFLNPIDMLSVPEPILVKIADSVTNSLGVKYSKGDIIFALSEIFMEEFGASVDEIESRFNADSTVSKEEISYVLGSGNSIVREIGRDGYLRSDLSSCLIEQFVNAIEFEPNEKYPALSKVFLPHKVLLKVEIIKKFVFYSIVMSPRLQVPQYRGTEIVTTIFEVLSDSDKKGYRLLPDDYYELYKSINAKEQSRIICDFIAGMTDRYAIEFYGRLKSENPQSVFKPLS